MKRNRFAKVISIDSSPSILRSLETTEDMAFGMTVRNIEVKIRATSYELGSDDVGDFH